MFGAYLLGAFSDEDMYHFGVLLLGAFLLGLIWWIVRGEWLSYKRVMSNCIHHYETTAWNGFVDTVEKRCIYCNDYRHRMVKDKHEAALAPFVAGEHPAAKEMRRTGRRITFNLDSYYVICLNNLPRN